LSKNDFHLKDNKNYGGGQYIKIHFICLSNARWNQKKFAFKIIWNVPPQKKTFSCSKCPPPSPHPNSVFSKAHLGPNLGLGSASWGVVFVLEFDIGWMKCKVNSFFWQKLIIIVLVLHLRDWGWEASKGLGLEINNKIHDGR